MPIQPIQPIQTDPCCRDCCFWVPNAVKPMVEGECRRHVPAVGTAGEYADFPLTYPACWCGEYVQVSYRDRRRDQQAQAPTGGSR